MKRLFLYFFFFLQGKPWFYCTNIPSAHQSSTLYLKLSHLRFLWGFLAGKQPLHSLKFRQSHNYLRQARHDKNGFQLWRFGNKTNLFDSLMCYPNKLILYVKELIDQGQWDLLYLKMGLTHFNWGSIINHYDRLNKS